MYLIKDRDNPTIINKYWQEPKSGSTIGVAERNIRIQTVNELMIKGKNQAEISRLMGLNPRIISDLVKKINEIKEIKELNVI
jgi:hypothetical protein